MSTRCNIILRTPDGAKVYLYRHCDGYPTGAGQTIWSVVLSLSAKGYDATQTHDPEWRRKWIGPFAKQLMATTGNGGDLHHEFTSGLHGDIEFLYLIDFGGFKDWGVPLDEPTIRIGIGYKCTEAMAEAAPSFLLNDMAKAIDDAEKRRRAGSGEDE